MGVASVIIAACSFALELVKVVGGRSMKQETKMILTIIGITAEFLVGFAFGFYLYPMLFLK